MFLTKGFGVATSSIAGKVWGGAEEAVFYREGTIGLL